MFDVIVESREFFARIDRIERSIAELATVVRTMGRGAATHLTAIPETPALDELQRELSAAVAEADRSHEAHKP